MLSAATKTSPIRERNRLRRREAIVELAREQFLSVGYAETTMSALAGLLGGSKSTLWDYFPTKHALLTAAIEGATAALHSELSQILQADDDHIHSLQSFATRLSATLTSRDALRLHRLVVSEANRFPEIGTIFYERAVLPVVRHLIKYFESEIQKRKMRSGDAAQAASELMALIQRPQLYRLWESTQELDSDKKTSYYLDHAVAAFIRAHYQ